LNEIQKYFRYRQALIEQYIRGDMTKSEYLSRNLDAVLSLNIRPFKLIDTVEKGLFNYQYYNALAKEAGIEAGRHTGETELYYREKDRATAQILKLLDYENVSAYFIKVRSKYLKGKIYEIILDDYNAIMHSKNKYLLEKLQRAGVFRDQTMVSVIDGYINQRY